MTSNQKMLTAFNGFVSHLATNRPVVEQWNDYLAQLRNDTSWTRAEVTAFGGDLHKLLLWKLADSVWYGGLVNVNRGEGGSVAPYSV